MPLNKETKPNQAKMHKYMQVYTYAYQVVWAGISFMVL